MWLSVTLTVAWSVLHMLWPNRYYLLMFLQAILYLLSIEEQARRQAIIEQQNNEYESYVYFFKFNRPTFTF